MNTAATVTLVVLILILARWAAQFWLARLNQKNVQAHAGAVPEAFKGIIDDATYAKSVQYTLAKSRLGQLEMTYMMP
jgi:STE24 endopeptidase